MKRALASGSSVTAAWSAMSSRTALGALGVCAAFVVWRSVSRSKGRDIARPAPRRIVVVSSPAEWALVVEDFLREVARLQIVGLDCEWVMSPPTFNKGRKLNSTKPVYGRNKVALLQLAPSDSLSVLIRLNRMEVPSEVVRILKDQAVIKVGVAVFDDAKKLLDDYKLKVRGCLDLRYMATCWQSTTGICIEDFSLAGLARRFANLEMNKATSLRCANWEALTLSTTEVEYAAMDAYAGLDVALALLEKQRHSYWRFSSTRGNQCWEEFGIFIDKPFRGAAVKKSLATENGAGQSPSKNSNDSQNKRRPKASATRKQQNIYKNTILQAPDGEVLCSTDELKLNWYLKMGLGKVVCQKPFTVRLNFEPRCRAILGGEYYVDEKTNECVVCGAKEHLLKKNVVTQQYRKLFPPIMKSHTSHDMVLLCVQCQLRYTRAEAALMERLDEECPPECVMPNFKRVKAAAMGLLRAGDRLSPERKSTFEQIVREHLGNADETTPLTEEELRSAGSISVCQWLKENNATHGLRVVKRYGSADGPGLFELEKLWRRHFLDTMKPGHLSTKWSVEHNHDAVLMKIATGRNHSGYTVEELLEVLGVDWNRMAELVDKIVAEGLVSKERILIWDLLNEHVHTRDELANNVSAT